MSAAPPVITQLRPAVPAAVATALQRALSKAPADLFPVVSQFSDALANSAEADRPKSAPRKRWMTIAGAAVVVAVVVVGGVLAMRRARARR